MEGVLSYFLAVENLNFTLALPFWLIMLVCKIDFFYLIDFFYFSEFIQNVIEGKHQERRVFKRGVKLPHVCSI
jgi:hypothetical protein